MGAGLQTVDLIIFFPTSSGGTSGCYGIGCSPAVVASPRRLVSLFRQKPKTKPKKPWYGCVSAGIAITYEVISFSKTDFINTPLPANFGKTRCVFSNGIGPGFVWISVRAGRDSTAALH